MSVGGSVGGRCVLDREWLQRVGALSWCHNEVLELTNDVTCVECGEELLAERAQLGYDYCTRPDCQARQRKGLTITVIGVNKSADSFIVADDDEIRARGEAGEFAKKDTNLGVGYRPVTPSPVARRRSAAKRAPDARTTPKRPWTAEQERIVRLYHDMCLAPAQIVERAGRNTPRLAITTALVVKILSAPVRAPR
jgi:hypothetical protein